jgi:hypothetical protein
MPDDEEPEEGAEPLFASDTEAPPAEEPVKRGPGRPRKEPTPDAGSSIPPKRPRGRPRGSRSRTRRAPAPKGPPLAMGKDDKKGGKEPPVPRADIILTADEYGDIWGAFHDIPAGLLSIPELSLTKEERDKTGRALQKCCDAYGIDFVQKLGPAMVCAITVGAVEVKVFRRVADGSNERKIDKARARRAQAIESQTAQAAQIVEQSPTSEPTPNESTMHMPGAVPTEANGHGGGSKAALAALQAQMQQVPEEGLVPQDL